MDRNQIAVGIIGCGTHALRGHIAPFLALPDLFKVAALCDPDKRNLEIATKAVEGDVSVFTDEKTFFAHARDELDALVVASPDRFHFEQLRRAIGADLHVLVEKPIVTSVAEVDRLRQALAVAKEKKLVVTSCHPRRFDYANIALQDDLFDLTKRHGPIVAIDFDFSYHEPSKSGLHSGLLADHLNHEFDLVTFLLGRDQTRVMKLRDCEDEYAAVAIREDGIICNFRGTRRLRTKVYPEFMRIRFSRAVLDLSYQNGVAIITDHEYRGHSKVEQEKVGDVSRSLYAPVDYVLRFDRMARHFAAAIHGTEPAYLTDEDMLRNNAVCAALTEGTVWQG